MVDQSVVMDVQIHRIRHLDEKGNGAILVCNRLDVAGNDIGRITLQMPGIHMPTVGPLHVGCLMRASGRLSDWKNPRDGRIEEQLRVTHWFPVFPSVTTWPKLVSHSPHLSGVPNAFSYHLADLFGDRLQDMLAANDVATLQANCSNYPPTAAENLCSSWAHWCSDTLAEWLSCFNLSNDLLPQVSSAYGGHSAALHRLHADPYRLLAFGVSWVKADSVSRRRFAVEKDDPRRLHAAVVYILQRRYREGVRSLAHSPAQKLLERLLRSSEAASLALAQTFRDGGFVRTAGAEFQLRGVWLRDQAMNKAAGPS
ncbi:helix-hairpin-helix domain-containing protein [Novosphingobium sp. TCA1]|uniref:helix-hairpin-helix domain-containing protein n=1 Tax=Novosphingobium sp. TCA1 TaxID=2682474 RepID=UPI0013587653|nr:helix-hairpin-helix domain-containing protein [Novosphingobium sp. TCA1]